MVEQDEPRWGFFSKMVQFYRKSKVQTVVFDKTGTLTERVSVTDVIGGEGEVPSLAAREDSTPASLKPLLIVHLN